VIVDRRDLLEIGRNGIADPDRFSVVHGAVSSKGAVGSRKE
jgi:hypothetical protein